MGDVVDFSTGYDPLFNAKMDRRDRALRHIRSAMMLEDDALLAESCFVLSRYLTEQEMVSLGYGVLRALPYEIAMQCAEMALKSDTMPSLVEAFHGSEVADAKLWSSAATQRELKAYAMQAFIQMAPAVRRRFRGWINGKRPR